MNVSRRTITQAIFDVTDSIVLPTALAEDGKWKSKSKDVTIWSEVAAYDQPYFGLVVPDDVADTPQAFGLTKWIRNYWIMIYFRRDDVPLAPGQYIQDILDDFLDAIDAAFAAPRKGEPNTLGGIVQNCYISGTVFTDSGTLDQQCAIIVPVSIITGI